MSSHSCWRPQSCPADLNTTLLLTAILAAPDVFHYSESAMLDQATLAKRVKEVSYLEGDFTLRSGKKSKYYMDKYLFETQPGILAALASRIAARRGPAVTRIAGAELGGV